MLAAAANLTSSLLAGGDARDSGDARVARVRREGRERPPRPRAELPRASRYSASSHPLAPHNLAARGYHTFTCLDEPFHVPRQYTLVRELGSGAYGSVALARDASGGLVAIKKVTRIFEREVLTRRALREVVALRHLAGCENVTQLIDLDASFVEFSEIYLYLSASDADLHQIFRSHQELSEAHIRYFMVQLLRAVSAMHDACILHRDLKPGNLLVNSDCRLRVCDFGLARPFRYVDADAAAAPPREAHEWPPESSSRALTSPREHPTPSIPRSMSSGTVGSIDTPQAHSATDMTPSESRSTWPARDAGSSARHERVEYPGGPLTEYVSTRWYRAPEVMLCFVDGYGPPMDMWSVGCIFAELLAGKPLCAGKDFMDQLVRIHNLLGTAPPSVIERIGSNRARIHVQGLPPCTGVSWTKLFPHVPHDALDLLARLLCWVPEERLSAHDALMHPWLRGYRTQSLAMPSPPPFTEFAEVECIRTPSEFARAFTEEERRLRGAGEGDIHDDPAEEGRPGEAAPPGENAHPSEAARAASPDASASPPPSPPPDLKRKASETLLGRARQLVFSWI